MARTPQPLWLARPSRFAGLSWQRARLGLGLLAIVLGLCWTALATPGPPPANHLSAQRDDDEADVVLYENIVEDVRHGGNYYQVAADELRRGDYPLRPFVTFRLPTLAVVEALLPPTVTVLLLYLLAVAVLVAWRWRLRPAFARPPPLFVALLLLVGGMMAHVQAELVMFHEVWAGLLIALSLALRRPGKWLDAAALGLAATLIRETAALYVLVMAAMAWRDGERREALGWAATLAVLAVVVAVHAHAVAGVVRPLDPASPGWAGMLGPGFFAKTMAIATALRLLPLWLAAPLVGLALAGWAAWRDPLGSRVFVVLVAYAALLSIFGRTDTFYWGLLVAPLLPVGLAFAPDGVRDLVHAALDRRRITVRRVTR